MKFGLTEKSLKICYAIFEKYPEIEEVIMYGSRAKGNYHPGSDVDLVLKGAQVTDFLRFKVWSDFDASSFPYNVDISVFHLLKSPELVQHINRVGQIFYKKSEMITSV
jgi:predicted nucleotidyltransferase